MLYFDERLEKNSMIISKEIISNIKTDSLFFDHLSEQLGVPFKKFGNGIEYEIKLSYNSSAPIVDINRMISDVLESSGYLSNRCETKSDYQVSFFQDDNSKRELSVFVYENRPMLKIKRHSVVTFHEFPVFKSDESYEYDREKIFHLLMDDNVLFFGNMRKTRCKDFIINPFSGLVFASAVTQCETLLDCRIQRQYEIEYYGHFEIQNLPISEDLILNELYSISSKLICKSSLMMAPSYETKFDFTTLSNPCSINKQDIIDYLQELLK